MQRYGRRNRRRKASRFFAFLICLLAGSWVTYHGISYLTLRWRPSTLAHQETQRPSLAVMAEVNPPTVFPPVQRLAAESDGAMPVKSGHKHAATRPADKPTPVKEPNAARQSDAKVESILAEARELRQQGKLIAARKVVNDLLAERFADPALAEARDLAVELGKQTILDSKIYADDPVCVAYRIDAGDTLERLARKNKIPYQFLMKINKISDRILEGQKIKLPKGPINLKVTKQDLTIWVFLQDVLFAKYDVCLGKNGKTPDGKWLVEDRIRWPAYVDPDTHKTFSGHDPNNPTGGFWVRLKGIDGDAVGKTGFGIHSTNEPDTIKTFASKGCIRLRKEDMSELFDLITPGATQVDTLP